jgi:hypothetical protein
MEQIYSHTSAHFVGNRKSFAKRMLNPRARAYYPIAPEYAMVISDKEEYIRNKPIFAGAAILDLSKVTMQNFWYGCLKPTFGAGVSLLQTDTDSMIIGITTPSVADFDSKILSIRDRWLDMSSYPEGHKFHSNANRKAPGFFKDECGDKLIREITWLGAKCYSILSSDEASHVKRAKGVPQKVVKHSLTRDHFKQCLTTGAIVTAGFHSLLYKKHHIYLTKQFKKALTWYDDKSYFDTPEKSWALAHHRFISS